MLWPTFCLYVRLSLSKQSEIVEMSRFGNYDGVGTSESTASQRSIVVQVSEPGYSSHFALQFFSTSPPFLFPLSTQLDCSIIALLLSERL